MHLLRSRHHLSSNSFSFYRTKQRRAVLPSTLRYRGHIGWNSSKIISWLLVYPFFSLQTTTLWIYSKGNTPNFSWNRSEKCRFSSLKPQYRSIYLWNGATGVGAQSTIKGKTFCPRNMYQKLTKMPEFYMILARNLPKKLSKYPNLWHLPKILTKYPNFTWFLPPKFPNFT